MIHHMYFEHIRPVAVMYRYLPETMGDEYHAKAKQEYYLKTEEYIGHKIKNSVDDTYIFVTTEGYQKPRFEQFLEDYELKDLIVKEAYVTNHNYPDRPKNLRLTIIQSKDHFQRKEYES